jgi:lipopolysaccharide/colanic/teichoic acid biosynthesis glycosyltransferase/glycosyltransferase involved in cell wall biosynthesis
MKRRACIVVASELTVRSFLVHQILAMQEHYDVTVVVNTTNARFLHDLGTLASLRPLGIKRHVSPMSDLRCLVALIRLMRTERFDLVHSVTPKAGLLAMVAAWFTRIPVRVHFFTGQVWATRTGISRAALKLLDKVVARATTFALADSPSQREFLIAEGIVQGSKSAVLGKGSICGVDPARFRPDPVARRATRGSLAIPAHAVTLLFVGRLHRDKGVLDLACAFARLADRRPDVHLLIVGPDEQNLADAIRARCSRHRGRLHFSGFTGRPELSMAASDILCLPSYREGFGSVIIEAAAVGLPAVASRIYGVTDAVIDGETGLLHDPADIEGIVAQLERLVSDPELRRSLGTSAQRRAARDFSQGAVTAAVLDLYARLHTENVPLERACAVVRHSARAGESSNAESSTPPRTARGLFARGGKRVLDVVAASAGILLLLPLTACLALLIRLFLGSPVLFRQRRPGLHGEPFVLVKFRSMTNRRDASGQVLPDDQRLTTFGRFLRATSLDEIPELWNVLVGDMSLVGPRPLLMEYLPLYTPLQARRHAVRPGITGLAQVNGRNGLSWEKRFELDVEYVDRCSLVLDAAILARTAAAVIFQQGIRQPGRATVDYFQGNAARHG